MNLKDFDIDKLVKLLIKDMSNWDLDFDKISDFDVNKNFHDWGYLIAYGYISNDLLKDQFHKNEPEPVSINNYFEKSEGIFELVVYDPNLYDSWGDAIRNWENIIKKYIRGSFKFNYESISSYYWANNKTLIRVSNHWSKSKYQNDVGHVDEVGMIRSCWWELGNYYDNKIAKDLIKKHGANKIADLPYKVGIIDFSDLKERTLFKPIKDRKYYFTNINELKKYFEKNVNVNLDTDLNINKMIYFHCRMNINYFLQDNKEFRELAYDLFDDLIDLLNDNQIFIKAFEKLIKKIWYETFEKWFNEKVDYYLK